MAKERKELIVLDGLTILFIVMLVTNGVVLALLYRFHNTQVFRENVKNQKVYSDLLATVRELKNSIVESEGVEAWEKSSYSKILTFKERGKKTYDVAGVTMDYPGDYASEVSADGKHLVLMNPAEASRIEDPTLPGSDGPTTITVDTFSREGKTLLDWVKSTKESNFDLSKGEYTKNKAGSIPAIVYEWSGLYEGTTYAVEGNDGSVILMSVTYLTRGDEIVKDFDLILSTLRKR